jgi:hypothetical protein
MGSDLYGTDSSIECLKFLHKKAGSNDKAEV